ncbi:MAG: M13 family metallopeptidase [Aerococcus sp.]|nr:M13 family metallopeptidase [Aerococcus sp.]
MATIDLTAARNDLYQAVNGEWIAQATIPEDKPATGGFNILNEDIEKLLMTDLEKFANGDIAPANPEEKEMTKYYQLAKDFDRRNAEGADDVLPALEKIQALKDFDDLQQLAESDLSLALPFGVSVDPDMKNTDQYEFYLDQPSLILPDKTYYKENREQGEQLLAVFKESAMKVFTLAGFSKEDADEIVTDAIAFDELLWPATWSSEQRADYTKIYNPRERKEVEEYSEHFSIMHLLDSFVEQQVDKVIVTIPTFFHALDDILSPKYFEQLKHWMMVETLYSSTDYLSEELRQAGAEYGLALSGSPKTSSPIKNAYQLTRQRYSQVIGCYYGRTYFGEKARADVEEMVKAMIDVYKKRLQANDWLSKATIEKAIVKLDHMDLMIGYPDTYPDVFKQYVVQPDKSLFWNMSRFSRIATEDRLKRWHQEVDRREWGMSAEWVNAYYSPFSNLICFPAGILQAPFYSLEQSPSTNFGGIGAVIGHEISHAFDNNGAQFDERGNLNNWWMEEDYDLFKQKAQAMIDQFNDLPLGEGKVNGKLTVSENIADAGGLNAAIGAIDEADRDDVAFFSNWARVWCMKARPEYQQMLLTIDVHAPNYWRANQQVQNLAQFHAAFHTEPGDAMYLAPADRVVIW